MTLGPPTRERPGLDELDEAATLREELALERRLARLVQESRAAAPQLSLERPTDARIIELEQQVAELEQALRLVRLSRAFRLGLSARRLQGRLSAAASLRRAASAPPAPVVEEGAARALDAPRGLEAPIVFFVPWLMRGSGGERFVADLAAALVAEGRDVVFVVTTGTPAAMPDATAETQSITPHVLDVSGFDGPARLAVCRALLEDARRPVAVNVGSHWLYRNVGALRAAAPALKVVDVLFNHVGHVHDSVRADLDTIVVAHDLLERLLVEHYRVETPVIAIPVGIPAPDGTGRVERSPRERPVVGWLGRLSPEKRPDLFVELALRLDGRADFRLGGPGPQLAAIRSQASGIGSLEVRGFVADNLAFVRDCDLLVITSDVEGISRSAMEAIAHGVPVVTTDVGGMHELVRPGVSGIVVPPGDADALEAAVRPLLDNPAALEGLRAAVQACGLPDEYRFDVMLRRFRAVLR